MLAIKYRHQKPEEGINVTIIYGGEVDTKNAILKSVEAFHQAARQKGYSENQITEIPVGTEQALQMAVNTLWGPTGVLISVYHGSKEGRVQLNANQDIPASKFVEMLQKFPTPITTIIWGCHMEPVGEAYAKQTGVPTWTAYGEAQSNLIGEGGIMQW